MPGTLLTTLQFNTSTLQGNIIIPVLWVMKPRHSKWDVNDYTACKEWIQIQTIWLQEFALIHVLATLFALFSLYFQVLE